jgi:translation elongation factor EF-G
MLVLLQVEPKPYRTFRNPLFARVRFGPLSGQVISSAKVACRAAFLACPVRLVEAFYACSLQCDQR